MRKYLIEIRNNKFILIIIFFLIVILTITMNSNIKEFKQNKFTFFPLMLNIQIYLSILFSFSFNKKYIFYLRYKTKEIRYLNKAFYIKLFYLFFMSFLIITLDIILKLSLGKISFNHIYVSINNLWNFIPFSSLITLCSLCIFYSLTLNYGIISLFASWLTNILLLFINTKIGIYIINILSLYGFLFDTFKYLIYFIISIIESIVILKLSLYILKKKINQFE